MSDLSLELARGKQRGLPWHFKVILVTIVILGAWSGHLIIQEQQLRGQVAKRVHWINTLQNILADLQQNISLATPSQRPPPVFWREMNQRLGDFHRDLGKAKETEALREELENIQQSFGLLQIALVDNSSQSVQSSVGDLYRRLDLFARRINNQLEIQSTELGERWDRLGFLIGTLFLLFISNFFLMLLTLIRDRQLLQVNEDLNRAVRRANSANSAKSRFVANMSHEIRTPMHGIIGTAELLLAMELSKEEREYIEIMKHSGQTLLGLLNDILDFSKIEEGHLLLQDARFELRETVEQVVQQLAIPAQSKSLDLICHIDPTLPKVVFGDSTRFRQVLFNLVGNAIKFTDTGHVLVEAKVVNLETASFYFDLVIRDTGIGIKDKDKAALFVPFSQVDPSNTRRHEGTGLGLSICKYIVLAMGGSIHVQSEFGKGSAFHVTVPLKIVPADTEDKPPLPLTTLILDDNPLRQTALKSQLKTLGQEAVLCPTLEEAINCLAKADKDRLALVFIDQDCADLDLSQWSAALRKAAVGPLTLALVLPMSQPIAQSVVEEKGIDTTVSRPHRQTRLKKLLKSVVRASQEVSESSVEIENRHEGPILIAEDNPINRMVLAKMVSNLGYTVVHAEDGEKAVEAADKEAFKAILMDCQMPKLDGIEATRKIRRQSSVNSKVPIIAVTASAEATERGRCVEAGMNGFLSKPVTTDRLESVLREFLFSS
ncbi:MAG: response regulator [Planctomycetota bacterium]|nr:response regulator [Planctomycetota bacterium]